MALFWDAPLEQLANPLLTPNPAKAPWYFLGLQELLHYFPPIVAGILIPTLVVLGLVVIPYFKINIAGRPFWAGNRQRRAAGSRRCGHCAGRSSGSFDAWTVLVPTVMAGAAWPASLFRTVQPRAMGRFLRSRPLSWWVMTWFIAVALTLTVVGTFFRGPGLVLGLALEIDMPPEEMGKVTKRLRLAFAVSSVVFLAVLAVSPVKDSLREWRRYETDYVRFAQTRPDTKRLLADFRPEIDQIWIPEMNVVDRCTTCHQGITRTQPAQTPPCPNLSVPIRRFRITSDWGCAVCHRGQGLGDGSAGSARDHARLGATDPAHSLTSRPPAAPAIAAICAETPRLDRGRELLARAELRRLPSPAGIERPAMLGPDLTNIGTKVSRAWIYKWLKEPRTITDSDGNVKVNGYESEDEPRMPQVPADRGRTARAFRLPEHAPERSRSSLTSSIHASWPHGKSGPTSLEQGETRFRADVLHHLPFAGRDPRRRNQADRRRYRARADQGWQAK